MYNALNLDWDHFNRFLPHMVSFRLKKGMKKMEVFTAIVDQFFGGLYTEEVGKAICDEIRRQTA